jgi:signal transduction histidine kinase
LSSRANAGGRDEFGQLAQTFNHMADQVQTTVDALRRFVSDAAHELHSPLTALRTDLDLAADEMDAVRRQQFVERAREMVARLEALTSNLLDLSRIEAKAGANERWYDLAALVREHCEAYASEAEQAGLAFELALPAGTVMMRGEPVQVTRALSNLIDNACKFTPQGGVVRCALARENGQIVLSVSDSGIGIPAEDLPQLFNRFHRGRNAVSYPGSGLGLAIAKAIMEQQGGTVVAENVHGGARFALQWPAASG